MLGVRAERCKRIGRVVGGVFMLLLCAQLLAMAETPPEVLGPCWVLEVIDGDTIRVRLPDERIEVVRYMGINAPELEDEGFLGPEARTANEALVGGRDVWLEAEPDGNDYLRHARRLLAYVFTDEDPTELVQEELLRQGLAHIDKRNIVDRELYPGAFEVRYADRVIEAQIEAAMGRHGVWGLDALYADRDLVIAAVRFWGYREVTYLVNRGAESINLGDQWTLMNGRGYEDWLEGRLGTVSMVNLGDYLGPECFLEPGGTLEVLTGPDIPQEKLHTREGCGTELVEFHWTRRHIWRNRPEDLAVLVGPEVEIWAKLEYPMRWADWAD